MGDFANAPEPKTRKGRSTLESLKEGAREVFCNDGYVHARVSDISAAAGLSNGAFYRYFTDKRHVMLSVVAELIEASNHYTQVSFNPDDPMASIRASTARYLRFYADNAGLMGVIVQAGQADPEVETFRMESAELWYRRIANMLRRAIKLGIARDDIDPDITAALLGGMTEHYAYLAFVQHRPLPVDPDEIAEHITKLWQGGAFSVPVYRPGTHT